MEHLTGRRIIALAIRLLVSRPPKARFRTLSRSRSIARLSYPGSHTQKRNHIQDLCPARSSIPDSRFRSVLRFANSKTTTSTNNRSNTTTINYMAMAQPDRSTVARGKYAAVNSAEVNPHQGRLIKYALVCVYSRYSKYSMLQNHLPFSIDDPTVFNITIFPPDHFNVEDNKAFYNKPSLSTNGFYCHGDPRSWAVLFPTPDRTIDELRNFEIMVSEQEFLAENTTDDRLRTMAWKALRILDDDKDYIVKHSSGDAVIDENGNKMLLIKFRPPNQTEGSLVFHLKRIVDGQKTVITERETRRLRLYLAGAFDGEDEESGQGGKGQEEVKDPDENEDEESGQGGKGKEEVKNPDETEDENEPEE